MNPEVVEVTEEDPKVVCNFCHKSTINSLEWGPMYQLDGVTVHYFCLLFSANLSQNGGDEEGILGFLPADIRKERKRGDKLKCKYCRKANATIGCSVSNCKYSYHYPCGYAQNCTFHFIGNFESYCYKHGDQTKVTLPQTDWDCPICYVNVNQNELLWPPCCKKRVFHKKCIMQSAKAAGIHFFKCPLCNNKEEFSVAMRKAGVYLPDRDATWETEPNAFADHRVVHQHCDAPQCICPKGRDHCQKSEGKPWHVVRCGTCGAFAIHKKCGNLNNLSWRCDTCTKVLSGKRGADTSRIRRRIDSDEESEDEPSSVNVSQAVMEGPVNRLPLQVVETDSDSEESISGIDSDHQDDSRRNEDEKARTQIFNVNSIYGRFIVDSDGDDDSEPEMEDYIREKEIMPEPDSTSHFGGTSSGLVIIRNENEAASTRQDSPGTSTQLGKENIYSNINTNCFDRDKTIRSGPSRMLKGNEKMEVVSISSEETTNSQDIVNSEQEGKKALAENIKPPTPDIVNLDDESSDSEIEVVGEKAVVNKKTPPKSTFKMSAAVMQLMKQSQGKTKIIPKRTVSNFGVSETFLSLVTKIQKEGPAYYAALEGTAAKKEERYEVPVLDIDSDNEEEKPAATTGSGSVEAKDQADNQKEHSKRERETSASTTISSCASNLSKRARVDI